MFLSGCGKSGPPSTKVSGTVTLDGKALADGEVMFVQAAAGYTPDILPVKDGKFEGTAKQGKVKVEFRAYRDVPPPTGADVTEEAKATPNKVNYLPARYNTETTLTAEVTDSGLNPSQFDLKSQ
jgi:hypothetical protein